MVELKWLVVAFSAVCALGLWFIAWKRVPEEKKNQRVYMYIAAVMLTIVAVLNIISLPS